MTDRINGVFVTFDSDIRDDDVEPLLTAIRMLKNVIDVTPNISDSSNWVAECRVNIKWRDGLFALMDELK